MRKLGSGIAVPITEIVLLGIGGLFGPTGSDGEIDQYLRRRAGELKPYPAPRFSTEADQTPARVNVTWVTPLGEDVAST